MRSDLGTDLQNKINLADQNEESIVKPQLLLHSCCGPCSTAVVERLIRDYEITVYFYNPNITDEEEYMKRKDAQESFVQQYNLNPDRVDLLHYEEGVYDPRVFYSAVKGHEWDPEGGDRCSICFRLRLENTAHQAMMGGFDYFTTTLSVSPHKNFELISSIGNEYSMRCGQKFLACDFKKKDGYRRSIQLSKEYCLYRQTYCGCEFAK